VEFRQAIGFMPEDAGNNSYLGITLFYLEKYNEAKKYLEKSLKLNPGLTENIKALAIIYESDNPAKALELWGLYLKNYPDTQEDREERDVIVEHVKELRKSYGNGK
jgi:tetratricopeptide (TPR) repeat protein